MCLILHVSPVSNLEAFIVFARWICIYRWKNERDYSLIDEISQAAFFLVPSTQQVHVLISIMLHPAFYNLFGCKSELLPILWTHLWAMPSFYFPDNLKNFFIFLTPAQAQDLLLLLPLLLSSSPHLLHCFETWCMIVLYANAFHII